MNVFFLSSERKATFQISYPGHNAATHVEAMSCAKTEKQIRL